MIDISTIRGYTWCSMYATSGHNATQSGRPHGVFQLGHPPEPFCWDCQCVPKVPQGHAVTSVLPGWAGSVQPKFDGFGARRGLLLRDGVKRGQPCLDTPKSGFLICRKLQLMFCRICNLQSFPRYLSSLAGPTTRSEISTSVSSPVWAVGSLPCLLSGPVSPSIYQPVARPPQIPFGR